MLRGWNPEGGPARHALVVDDVYIRNVPTDIRSCGGDVEKDGNSIFIFEVAGLCIGHLGHLHHRLEDAHYGAIGRLDIVMVPIDGGMTLSLAAHDRDHRPALFVDRSCRCTATPRRSANSPA